MTTATIELDLTLMTRLQHLAEQRGSSLAQVVRDALESLETQAREEEENAYYRRAVQALANYRKTGLHLTGDEFIDWLEHSDPGAPLPPCHT